MQTVQTEPTSTRRMLGKKSNNLSNMTVDSVETAASYECSKYAEPALELDFSVPMLGPEHMNEIGKQNGFEADQTAEHYDYMSTNYEEIYKRLGYPDPEKVAEMAEKHVMMRGLDKACCRVLDLGCGTGLVGQALADRGFRNIVGLDISTGMMEKAGDKKVYENLLEHDILKIDEFPQDLVSGFDVVVGAGIINNNHLDDRVFKTMMLAAKKNALIVFAARHSFIGEYWYEPYLAKYQRENRLRLHDECDFFKYDKVQSSIGRFSRTPVRVFAFENILDTRTYTLSKTVMKQLKQAIYNKMVVKKSSK